MGNDAVNPYRVQSDDTGGLYQIIVKDGKGTVQQWLGAVEHVKENGHADPNIIHAGEILMLPVPKEVVERAAAGDQNPLSYGDAENDDQDGGDGHGPSDGAQEQPDDVDIAICNILGLCDMPT